MEVRHMESNEFDEMVQRQRFRQEFDAKIAELQDKYLPERVYEYSEEVFNYVYSLVNDKGDDTDA